MALAQNLARAYEAAAQYPELDDQELIMLARNPKSPKRGRFTAILDNRSVDGEPPVTTKKTFRIGGAMSDVEFTYPVAQINEIAGGSLGLDLISAGANVLVKGFLMEALTKEQFNQKISHITTDVFGNNSGSTSLGSQISAGKNAYQVNDKMLDVSKFEFLITPFNGILVEVLPNEYVTINFNVTIVEK